MGECNLSAVPYQLCTATGCHCSESAIFTAIYWSMSAVAAYFGHRCWNEELWNWAGVRPWGRRVCLAFWCIVCADWIYVGALHAFYNRLWATHAVVYFVMYPAVRSIFTFAVVGILLMITLDGLRSWNKLHKWAQRFLYVATIGMGVSLLLPLVAIGIMAALHEDAGKKVEKWERIDVVIAVDVLALLGLMPIPMLRMLWADPRQDARRRAIACAVVLAVAEAALWARIIYNACELGGVNGIERWIQSQSFTGPVGKRQRTLAGNVVNLQFGFLWDGVPGICAAVVMVLLVRGRRMFFERSEYVMIERNRGI